MNAAPIIIVAEMGRAKLLPGKLAPLEKCAGDRWSKCTGSSARSGGDLSKGSADIARPRNERFCVSIPGFIISACTVAHDCSIRTWGQSM